MTSIQELQDQILDLESQIAGKRMELAMAQGERDTARQHQQAMYQAIQRRREFRIGLAEQASGCFFDAAGGVDAAVMNGGERA